MLVDLRYFDYEHLPEELRAISKPFHDLAHKIASEPGLVSDGEEQRAGLRKLLEAKDCIVRSRLPRRD